MHAHLHMNMCMRICMRMRQYLPFNASLQRWAHISM